MTIAVVVTIAVVLAIILVLGKFFIGLIALAIPLAIAGVVLLFLGDKISGGDSLEQLAERITAWLRRHGVGG